MKPAVTNRNYRLMCMIFTFAACLFSPTLFAQPDPVITGESTPCRNEVYHYSTPFNNNSWIWSISNGGTIISPVTENGVWVEWPGQMNSNQWIRVVENDGVNPPVAVQMDIAIANSVLSCENNVNISVDQSGVATITPDMLLDGNYLSYENFQVSLSLPNGVDLGDQLTCANIGQNIIGKVTDGCTGNHCWSNVKIEDKKAPVWDCPNSAVPITCSVDVDTFPHPPVDDNCTLAPLVSLANIQVDNSDVCVGVTITKDWVASDEHGNESYCTQVLQIDPNQTIVFPDDRAWFCTPYYLNPQITDPTTYTGNYPNTGSGKPIGAGGPYCNYSVGNTDDTLYTCGNTLKIIRTWTVINWCTQEIITTDMFGNDNEQVIKVIDVNKPSLTVPQIELVITEAGPSSIACRSKDLLPAPSFSDDCGDVTIKIFTEIGEAIYVNGVDGKEGGYVPHPGLGLGPHVVTYQAIDDCGNEEMLQVDIMVTDKEAPIAICDEITEASLDHQGSSLVYAETFDDGSFDNCCISEMLVKRMGQSDAFFAPAVPFDCNDNQVNVVFRVIDCFDNYAECMVVVNIGDKLPPQCVAPQQKIISCTTLPPDIDNDFVQSFGDAFTQDNCNAEIIELPYEENINDCGEGHIIRYFKAMDDNGNENVGTCEQHIYVESDSDWKVNFPPNWTGSCGQDIPFIDIIIGEFGCENLAYNYEDEFFALTLGDSACYKLVRTWEIINWCTYDPNLDPIAIPTSEFGVFVDEEDYNNHGHYVYQQIIKVQDDSAPVLSTPFSYEFCTDDPDCNLGEAFLPIKIDGECQTNYDIVYYIDLEDNGTIDAQGTGFFEGILSIGQHSVRYLVEDGCNNTSEIEFDFEIRDCKKPSPVCSYGLIVEIMQTGLLEVCAEDLLEYATDNCTGPLKVSFSQDVNDACVTLNCEEVGQNPVQIWVTDAAGNQDYCDNVIILQDNMNVCNGGGGQPLVGNILNHYDDEPIEGVEVNLTNTTTNDMYTTDGTGMYQFLDLPVGDDYTVSPILDMDHINGVTTYDLVMISKHILGVDLLNTTFQMIAADANNSGTVTTFDLVEIRKLILHVNDDFPNNTSWRFIDKAYSFPDAMNPWAEIFPEVINVNNHTVEINDADFIGVKIGDVNGSAVPNNNLTDDGLGDRSSDLLMFNSDKKWVEAGEQFEVTFRAKDFIDVYGFQFTIDFQKDLLNFLHINETEMVKYENYGLSLLNEGAITMLWFDTDMWTLDDGEVILSLQFEAIEGCEVETAVNISSRYTFAAAYVGEELEEWEVDLDFEESVTAVIGQEVEGFALHQNVPNPFSTTTSIGFELPTAGDATITIYDNTGRILMEIEDTYSNGYNAISIDRKALPANGVLLYKIESQGLAAVRKMTIVD